LSELGGVLSFDCIYLADNKPQIFLAVFYITSAPRDREYTKKYCQGVVNRLRNRWALFTDSLFWRSWHWWVTIKS
jgi:hypothetical protein